MSGSTGAMLLLGVFLLAVTVFASVYRVVSLGLASTALSVASGYGEQLRTRISITSTDVDFITTGEGRCATYLLAIDSYVGNTGKTTIQKYEDMDVILHYSPEGGGNTAVHPSYSEDSVSEGEWTVLAVNPNTFASTTWNPAETATIRLRPSVAAEPRTEGAVVVSTPEGITDTAYVEFDYDAVGANDCRYLHNNPTPPVGDTNRQPDGLTLDKTEPTASTTSPFYNYDQDFDGNPGRSINEGGSGPDESDPGQYQVWRSGPLGAALTLSGTMAVDLWGSSQNFSQGHLGIATVYFRDYDGAAYTEIGQGTIFTTDWQSGVVGDFVRKVILIPGFDYTIPAGNELEVKLIVDNRTGSELWFAYDSITRKSLVNLSYVEPVFTNVFYLHNNPSPPVGDTDAQAVLPMDTTTPTATTIYNYNQNHGASDGRSLQRTSLGLSETNLRRHQIWRTDPLANDLTISGDVTIDVYAASANYTQGRTGVLTGYLGDYNGTSTAAIGNASVYADDWQEGSTTFVRRSMFIPEVTYTVPAGNQLEFFLVAELQGFGNMWIGYDTVSTPSIYLKLP